MNIVKIRGGEGGFYLFIVKIDLDINVVMFMWFVNRLFLFNGFFFEVGLNMV